MTIFLIVISLIALAFYPFSTMVSVFLSVTAVALAFFGLKDKSTTKKVLQPALLLGVVICFDLFFNGIIYLIDACGRLSSDYILSDFANFVSKFGRVIDIITFLAVVTFVVLSIVMYVSGKDVPVVDQLAENILEGKSSEKNKGKSKQGNKQSAKQDTKENVEETNVETQKNQE
ncbi:MAG: hypothetical protein ACI4T8_00230 [Christensenellales bacterium]